MLELGSTYLIVRNMHRSIAFYEALLQMEVSVQRFNRWAQFNFNGHCIALLNPDFDLGFIKQDRDLMSHFNPAYLYYLKKRQIQYGNNMVLNFFCDDLNAEYERITRLGIGEMSALMYLNISSPYYHFHVKDPDGNTVEITGKYSPPNEV